MRIQLFDRIFELVRYFFGVQHSNNIYCRNRNWCFGVLATYSQTSRPVSLISFVLFPGL